MGKSSSSSSCLKMIACGSNTAAADSDGDVEDHPIHHLTLTTQQQQQQQQTKASSDKRGWSFRKKSGRNNLTSESPTFSDKAPETETETESEVTTHFQSPLKSTITDDKHAQPQLPIPPLPADNKLYDEKPQLPIPSLPADNKLYDEKPQLTLPPLPADKLYDEKPQLPKTPLPADKLYDEKPQLPIPPLPADNKLYDEKPQLPIPPLPAHKLYDEKPQLLEPIAVDALPESHSKPLSNHPTITTSPQPDHTLMLLENATFQPPIHLGTLIHTHDFQKQVISQDATQHDPLAITLQASIRGFLTRRHFLHLKNVVTLQAVIRGYLVRRNAVETLHCIRGIAKVQALVRAHTSKSLDQNYIVSEGQFSTAKLLKNSFARQLMESTPRPNTVNIRCDPFSPNSAWAWLERWMSVTSAELEKVNQVEPRQSQADIELSSRSLLDSFDSKSIVDEIKKSSEGNHVVDPIDSQSSPPFFVEKEQPDDHVAEELYDRGNSMKMDAFVTVSSDSHTEPASLPDEAATEIQQAKLCAKRSASEELNGEVKKLICGSRKASHLEVGADATSFPEKTCIRTIEPSVVGVDVTSDPGIIVAGSECGTELSITSTLDSPDRCELQNAQTELQVKILETSAGCETNPVCDVHSETTQQEEAREFPGGLSVTAVVAQVLPLREQKLEIKASDESMKFPSVVSDVIEENEQKEVIREQDVCLEYVTGLPAEKVSSETSPRSHLTVPESHGTPSSQASVKNKRNKIGKSGSNTKCSSLSAGKRSPSNLNLESGSRSNVEHLAKDHTIGKRRNSFGATKSDADQEPRDSNSYNSVPSYMQATKSAKAKAHSPRSSPDFHDKEVNSKKRPSLPAAAGRQGSPRVQRSPSEAMQGAKANGSHPSNERKWQR